MAGRSSMERNVRTEDSTPVLARLARSSAERDKRRVPGVDYARHRRVYQQERPVMHPFHHTHSPHQHRLPSVEHPADDFRQSHETPQSYRGNVSLPPHSHNLFAEHATSKRSMRSMSSSEQYDRSVGDRRPSTDLYSLNRRHQCAGLTRSLTERRPKAARLDRNFRRSFTGRVEDYRTESRMERRANFSMETSL